MKNVMNCLSTENKDFLRKKLGKNNLYDANSILREYSGINNFFKNDEQLSLFLKSIEERLTVCESDKRREYGDFQTPFALSNLVCKYLIDSGVKPTVIIEPTFGTGSFLLSALESFPEAKFVYGIEIFESYFWETKFKILKFFLDKPQIKKPQIFLFNENIFSFDFRAIESAIKKQRLLLLGNPPWVTNAELGSLQSANLPTKTNFKSHKGIEAITGKGNFDIGEYITLLLLEQFSQCEGTFAMLIKNSVIKNLVYSMSRLNDRVGKIKALSIDAKKSFNAAVEASLFMCNFDANPKSRECQVYSLSKPSVCMNKFGWYRNKFVADIEAYKEVGKYDGECPYEWRQGIKHDCSEIMELNFLRGKFKNGKGEELELEQEIIYPLLKSSDLDLPVINETRKSVIVTQKRVGDPTDQLKNRFPNLFKYLSNNLSSFQARKSNIYKDKPNFSIFGVGDYSFKKYKVAISGLYKRSSFSLVLPVKNKPVMLDDTCYFLGFDDIDDAVLTWAILNNRHTQQLLSSIVFLDSKRPFTKDVLMRIDIPSIISDISLRQMQEQISRIEDEIEFIINEEIWEEFKSKLADNSNQEKQLALFSVPSEKQFLIRQRKEW